MIPPARRRSGALAALLPVLAPPLLALLALAGPGCGPPRPGVTLRLAPDAAAALRGARSVWIDGAVATLADEGGSTRLRLDEELAAALAQRAGLTLAPRRAAADLVILFVQSDALACPGCPRPGPRWQWWAFVGRPDGTGLAQLHGELPRDGRPPVALVAERLGGLIR